jgi:hypothetical protein
MRFNPKKLGVSDDPRDLSWRLLEFKLTSNKPDRLDAPDYLISSTWWPDKWVGDHFKIRVRVDFSTPILQVSGEMPASLIRPELRVIASDQLLGRFQFNNPGLFTKRVSLAPLVPKNAGQYAELEFISNYSFNPKKLKISSDYRDLSWRLYEVKLVPQ